MKLTLEQVYELMDKLVSTGLGEVEIEAEGVKVKLKAKEPKQQVVQAVSAAPAVSAAAAPAPAAAAPSEEKELSGKIIKSPIVGTFYQASAPDKEPFVRVGDIVRKGDVVFIIESMKLMNEVVAENDGIIEAICVENGQLVEYGTELFRIKEMDV